MVSTNPAQPNFGGTPAHGIALSSHGTTLFVLNKDATALNSGGAGTGAEPWSFVSASPDGTGHANVQIQPVPGDYLYLDLAVIWNEATLADLTTAPKVLVFGKVPAPPIGLNRRWPYDADTDFEDVTEFWIPLTDSDGVNEIELSGDLASKYTEGTEDFCLGVSSSVSLDGCTSVMALIDTAAAGADKAMIVGRFSG